MRLRVAAFDDLNRVIWDYSDLYRVSDSSNTSVDHALGCLTLNGCGMPHLICGFIAASDVVCISIPPAQSDTRHHTLEERQTQSLADHVAWASCQIRSQETNLVLLLGQVSKRYDCGTSCVFLSTSLHDVVNHTVQVLCLNPGLTLAACGAEYVHSPYFMLRLGFHMTEIHSKFYFSALGMSPCRPCVAGT